MDAVDKMGRVGYAERLPVAFGKEIYIRYPQQINLETNVAHAFHIEVPGASAIALGSSKVWLQLNPASEEPNDPWRLDGRFIGTLFIPEGGNFCVYVKFGDGPYQPWVQYLAL